MICTYQNLWPSHPFLFRVPYQTYPKWLKAKHGQRVEFVETPKSIKQTLLTLISDLDDSEWIYWCIDDKYLVSIDQAAADACVRWVAQIADADIQGVLFCRCRKLLDEDQLRDGSGIENPFGYEFVERKNCYQFWVPQFMRVAVLREIFLSFPDHDFSAKQMDNYTGQTPGLDVREFEPRQKMYVSRLNYARFGESSTVGCISKNCYDSMIAMGLTAPAHMERSPRSMFFGDFAAEQDLS